MTCGEGRAARRNDRPNSSNKRSIDVNRFLTIRAFPVIVAAGLAVSAYSQTGGSQNRTGGGHTNPPTQPNDQNRGAQDNRNQDRGIDRNADPNRQQDQNRNNMGAGQNNMGQNDMGQNRGSMAGAPAWSQSSDFRSCDWLKNRDVVNATGEDDVAEVEDLLIDRGSGRIEYVILDTDTVLGFGGREIAVPFQSLRWDASRERFVMNASAEQLRQYPRWDENDWTTLGGRTPGSQNWNDRNGNRVNDPANNTTNTSGNTSDRDAQNRQNDTNRDMNRAGQSGSTFNDYYHSQHGSAPRSAWDDQNLDFSRATKVRGTVRDIERVYVPNHGEQMVAVVDAEGGGTQRVAFGPSWYMSGAKSMPSRGDKIVLDAVQLPATTGEHGTVTLLATSVRTRDNAEDMRLRGKEGTAWGQKTYSSNGRTYAEPAYRFIRISDLEGAPLECRSADCGKVEDVIVDVANERVAFLSIDPDQNFLGMGDTKRLAPWSIVTVSLDDRVRLDADKDMILASPKTPRDFRNIYSSGELDTMYRAYQTTPPSAWDANDRNDRTRQTEVDPSKTDR
jgi:sporulation protein YlmC with PRC-barrel domain